MDYKQAFLSQLENSYLGVQIQDAKDLFSQDSLSKEALKKSGFINLLQMKSKYFGHIKNLLEKEKLNHSIYTKLYNFFSSYLNETGTPFFYDTPMHKNIYAKVYTNSKDTSLFYKTQNLYYVKSDTLYHDAEITSQDSKYTFIFDTSHFIPNADNAKNKAIFKFTIEENIRIYVLNNKEELQDLPNIFKQNSAELSDDFLKALKNAEIKIKEEEIKKILHAYKKQNEIDFFIHKNARAFLQEQFNLWMFKYVVDDITDWSKEKIDELNQLKKIAFAIIDLIADFEDELKAIWCKPKFAKKVEYVFSLDRINSALLDSIINDEGFKAQIKEWQELKLVEEDEKEFLKNFKSFIDNFKTKAAMTEADNEQSANSCSNVSLFEKYKFLPIDTKHFSKATKYKILSSFKDIESSLNGELIKSDNFQALNTLLPKYQNKVDLIYIDPPFNTGSDFEYKDKFQDSTWLTLMENRLELAKEFLSDRGSFYLHLDHNANYRGRELLNVVFGEENFRNEIIWAYRSGGASKKESMPRKHDNIWLYAKNETFYISPLYERQYYEVNFMNSCKQDNEGRFYTDTLLRDILEGDIKVVNGNFLKEYNVKPVLNLSSEHLGFGTQKPEGLLNILLDIASSKGDSDNESTTGGRGNSMPLKCVDSSIVLDFFVGSGTTIATAHKLGRKWLGVEMGEHFYKVIIPRMKKVIGGFASGISKEVEFKGGGAFRYYELESYEEALENCEYMLDKDSIINYRKSRKLIKGIKKGEAISLDMSGYRENFDILHTMANVLGLRIQRLFLDSKGIECAEFDNGDIVPSDSVDLCKYPKLTKLIWWEK